jgi:hypothetical protein
MRILTITFILLVFFSSCKKQQTKTKSEIINKNVTEPNDELKINILNVQSDIEYYLKSNYSMCDFSLLKKVSDSSFLYNLYSGVSGSVRFLSINKNELVHDRLLIENFDSDGFDIKYTYSEVEFIDNTIIEIKEFGMTDDSTEENEIYMVKKKERYRIKDNRLYSLLPPR